MMPLNQQECLVQEYMKTEDYIYTAEQFKFRLVLEFKGTDFIDCCIQLFDLYLHKPKCLVSNILLLHQQNSYSALKFNKQKILITVKENK